MGYRSDVGLCLTATGKKALDAALAELEPDAETTRHLHELLNAATKREDETSGAVAWFWEWIKWYSEYEDVAFIDKVLESLDDADYFFIRVGEDEMCLLRGIGFE